jgi:hypothetical protein
VSIPYGYPSWADLVSKVLNSIRYPTDMTDDIFNKIQEHISKKCYMNATEEMSKCWPNLENFVCHEISIIQPNTTNSAYLEKYLPLFPSHLYLTTNYDSVVGNILKQSLNRFHEIVATTPTDTTSRIGLREGKEPMLWYLHGKYNNPDSIIFSNADYNYFYGSDTTTDLKSIRRQLLARKLQEIYLRDPILFIGFSMNMREDRLLKLLKRFNQMGQQPENYSYALLEIPKNLIAEREKELLTIRVRPIWYSSEDENAHEQSKEELFEYILGSQRKAFEAQREARRKEFEAQREENEAQRKREQEIIQEFENSSKIVRRIPYEQKYYNIKKDNKTDYEFVLIKGINRYYLSDQGRTYEMLDSVFELKEPEVQRNLEAILRECNVSLINGKLVIFLESLDGLTKEEQKQLLDEARCRLFACVSFMDKMRIFYV